jgi:hypothetical protein
VFYVQEGVRKLLNFRHPGRRDGAGREREEEEEGGGGE